MRVAPPLLAAALVLGPSAAFAVDYMTADAAARLMFPSADRFEERDWQLDAAQVQAINATGVRARSSRWKLRLAYSGTQLLGVVVADDVLGKFELISYAVGIGNDGKVRGVEILSYRESHGHEIRTAAWRKQFTDKGPDALLRVGDDIASISGATLSCLHITEGVKRIVAVVDQARRGGVLG